MNSPHKCQWDRALMFSFICAWTNGRVNNQDTSDLRCHCTHYEVTAMKYLNSWSCIFLLSTHWGGVTHICVSKLTIIGSDNSLSPGRRQAIIWTNAGILFIGTLGTNFNVISSKIHTFSFKKMHLKISSAKWRPFCLGLSVLTQELFTTATIIETLLCLPGVWVWVEQS